MGKSFSFNAEEFMKPDVAESENNSVLRHISKASTENIVKASPFVELNIDDIQPNVNNFYSVENKIEELKFSILKTGLQEPLIVLPPEDGIYTILSGHRRYKALSQLYKEGYEQFGKVYCRILDPNELDVNLSYEDKVKWLITTTNSEQRVKTNADMMNEYKVICHTYKRLKENGENVPSVMRYFIAQSLGVSESQINRFQSIEKYLIEGFLNMFYNDKVSLRVAHTLTKMTEELQEYLYEKLKDEDTVTQIKINEALAEKKSSETPRKTSLFYFTEDDKTETKNALKSVTKIMNNETFVSKEVAQDAYNKFKEAVDNFIAVFSDDN